MQHKRFPGDMLSELFDPRRFVRGKDDICASCQAVQSAEGEISDLQLAATMVNHDDATDTTPNGVAQSGGVMVNCLYDQTQTERNHESFVQDATRVAARGMHALAAAPVTTQIKDPPP